MLMSHAMFMSHVICSLCELKLPDIPSVIMASSSAGMASSVGPAGASTPGEGLKMATWNVGLNSAQVFRKNNAIAGIMDTLGDRLQTICEKVGFVAINELHAAHHATLNSLLARAPLLAMIGFGQGDAIVWCRSAVVLPAVVSHRVSEMSYSPMVM